MISCSISPVSANAFQGVQLGSGLATSSQGKLRQPQAALCGNCSALARKASFGFVAGLCARVRQRNRVATLVARADKEESPDIKTSVDVEILSDESLRRRLEASLALQQPAALPFLPPPKYRDFIVNCPGDAGFDPASLARDLTTFRWMQESELKHSRIAMVSVVLWPLSELDCSFLDLEGALQHFPFALVLGMGSLAAAIPEMSKMPESPPGYYGFDPLNLKDFEMPMSCWLPKGRRWMAEAELKHGRLAMLACLAFAFIELSTKVPIVRHAPFQ